MSNKTRTQLSPKQLLFLQTYIKLGNATQALIKAGYKTKNAGKYCSELLAKPYIKAELERARKAIQQKTDITFDWKMNKLKEIVLESTKPQDRISAIEVMNKMQGDNAPEKHHTTNVNVDVTLDNVKTISEQYFVDYKAKLDKD